MYEHAYFMYVMSTHIINKTKYRCAEYSDYSIKSKYGVVLGNAATGGAILSEAVSGDFVISRAVPSTAASRCTVSGGTVTANPISLYIGQYCGISHSEMYWVALYQAAMHLARLLGAYCKKWNSIFFQHISFTIKINYCIGSIAPGGEVTSSAVWSRAESNCTAIIDNKVWRGKYNHVTPFLKDNLHWLWVPSWGSSESAIQMLFINVQDTHRTDSVHIQLLHKRRWGPVTLNLTFSNSQQPHRFQIQNKVWQPLIFLWLVHRHGIRFKTMSWLPHQSTFSRNLMLFRESYYIWHNMLHIKRPCLWQWLCLWRYTSPLVIVIIIIKKEWRRNGSKDAAAPPKTRSHQPNTACRHWETYITRKKH